MPCRRGAYDETCWKNDSRRYEWHKQIILHVLLVMYRCSRADFLKIIVYTCTRERVCHSTWAVLLHIVYHRIIIFFIWNFFIYLLLLFFCLYTFPCRPVITAHFIFYTPITLFLLIFWLKTVLGNIEQTLYKFDLLKLKTKTSTYTIRYISVPTVKKKTNYSEVHTYFSIETRRHCLWRTGEVRSPTFHGLATRHSRWRIGTPTSLTENSTKPVYRTNMTTTVAIAIFRDSSPSFGASRVIHVIRPIERSTDAGAQVSVISSRDLLLRILSVRPEEKSCVMPTVLVHEEYRTGSFVDGYLDTQRLSCIVYRENDFSRCDRNVFFFFTNSNRRLLVLLQAVLTDT